MAPRKGQPKVLISSTTTALRVPRKRLSELIRFVAADEGARLAEVDLAVVTGPQMAALNRRYLDRSGPTDVLSFDLTESGERGLSAQLIVCGETAVASSLQASV